MRISGWQRLWVLGLAASLVFIGTVTWATLPAPTAAVLTRAEFSAVIAAWEESHPDQSAAQGDLPDVGTGLGYRDIRLPPQTVLDAAVGEKLRQQRGRHFLTAGLLWLALGGLTYALGWAVGWVRRGFATGGHLE